MGGVDLQNVPLLRLNVVRAFVAGLRRLFAMQFTLSVHSSILNLTAAARGC